MTPQMEPGQKMIPCTDAIMNKMLGAVLKIMVESGLVDVQEDDEAMAEQSMQVFREQGLTTESGDVKMGQCILLPPPGIHLLIATPWPADQYGPELQRKTPPIQFERTEQDEIIIPFRWILGKLEELASNPAASEELQTFALNMSRRAENQPDIVLPSSVETVALKVEEEDGTTTITEALAAGSVILISPVEKEG